MSRVRRGQRVPYATAIFVSAALIPDVDAISYLRGTFAAYQHHRGFTHTLVGLPVMAAAAVAVVWIATRFRSRPSPFRWGLLYVFALLGVASHLALDLTLSYGLRPFEPFSYRWYSLDLNLVIEPWITLALLLGLIMSRLVKPTQRRIPVVLAFVAIACVWMTRAYEQHRVIATLASLRPEAVRSSAFPYVLSPFWWHGVVETENAYETMEIGPQGVPPGATVNYPKLSPNDELRSAQRSVVGQVCVDRAVYPLLRESANGADRVVSIYDLRWTYPSSRNLTYCIIQLNSALQPIAGGLTTGPLPEGVSHAY
jgi:inner membrane protein